jgi:hypothetical protein
LIAESPAMRFTYQDLGAPALMRISFIIALSAIFDFYHRQNAVRA